MWAKGIKICLNSIPEKYRERGIPLQNDKESQRKRQSYPNNFFENCRKGAV